MGIIRIINLMVTTNDPVTMKVVTPTATTIFPIIIVTVIATIMADAPIRIITQANLMMINHHRTSEGSQIQPTWVNNNISKSISISV